ncbi:MAG: class I SAM-dependent methyltransferase, partial [Pseudomonadota bacterium]
VKSVLHVGRCLIGSASKPLLVRLVSTPPTGWGFPAPLQVALSGWEFVLELGTNYGYSALRMARNLSPSAIITTIEIDHGLAAIAEAVITFAGMADRINQIRGEARRVIPQLAEPFDLIFVDHLKEAYLDDLNLLERAGLVREGTVVVSDNVVIFETQLRAYLSHLRDSGAYESALHQPAGGSDGIEVSIRLATP